MTTVMLCSKFSPMCIRILESIKQLNIPLEPHFKLVWIDHPTTRQKLLQSDISTVPAILKNNEKIEGEQFVSYMNEFIQKNQPPQGFQQPQQPQGYPPQQPQGYPPQQPQGYPPQQPQGYPPQQPQGFQQPNAFQQQQAQYDAQQQAQQQLLAQQQAQQQQFAQQQAVLLAQQQAQQQQAMLLQQQQVQQEASQMQHAQQQVLAQSQVHNGQSVQAQSQAQLQVNQQAQQQAQGHAQLYPREEGTTSLLSILGDKSLFDFQEEARPSGTDSRMSDHSESLLQGSKRNSINQRVRSMSTDRVPIKPVSEDEIDGNDLPFLEPTVNIGKKKSISDMAKELAKGRD
jgi:hypothetical protein